MEYADEVILEAVGDFKVIEQHNRNYLYQVSTGKRLAECVNGDYNTRFGGIVGWLSNVSKRSQKRVNVIGETITSLVEERDVLMELTKLIRKVQVNLLKL